MVKRIRFFLFVVTASMAWAAGEKEADVEADPSTAILFPWFSEVLGVIIFFLMTRFLRNLPYTAIMFLLGTFMGVGATTLRNMNLLSESIWQWGHINSEVLLLVFLPGLMFKDSFAVNTRLFLLGINQLILLAFPMVLAGTCLTSLIGFYILPYQWSWNLSMTFGSILAATDPVAVCALMDEVGAPPRLKIHISGESMLNDGSAYVFYTIFSALFFYELGIPGFGEEFDVARGFAIFFRMAFAGAAIGLAFGLGLVLILYCLSRRLNKKENIVQVAATITIAYLCYYVGDICQTSGLIATIVCGITTKAFGNTLINDPEMMESFWLLVDYLLNTLLFCLAGTVWGAVIASSQDVWNGHDWGYMLLVYVLVNVIRFFLVGAFYPLISWMGLGSCWQEAVFLSYTGLRGVVGIALSLSLDNEVRVATGQTRQRDEDIYVTETTQAFAVVGGVALLTLVVNGTWSGPVLKKLGLTKSSSVRVKLLDDLQRSIRQHMMDEFVKLLAEFRFADVDFSVIKHHVTWLQDMTIDELKAAVQRNEHIATPKLDNTLPYLSTESQEELDWAMPREEGKERRRSTIMGRNKSLLVFDKEVKMDTDELRHFFVGILRCAYGRMVEHGELDGRDSFVTLVLLDGLEFAATDVDAGKPLKDWETTESVSKAGVDQIAHFLSKNRRNPFRKAQRYQTIEYQKLRIRVNRAMAFIHAHQLALEYFEEHIATSFASAEFGESEKLVVGEVKAQMKLAQKVIDETDDNEVEAFESHTMCFILLNRTALYVESLLSAGVLDEREANGYLQEIEEAIIHTHRCTEKVHRGQLGEKQSLNHSATLESGLVTNNGYDNRMS